MLANVGQVEAVAVLHCVRTHKATWHFYKNKAAHLQAQIEAALPAEISATAISRGENCTMAELVGKVLNAVTMA